MRDFFKGWRRKIGVVTLLFIVSCSTHKAREVRIDQTAVDAIDFSQLKPELSEMVTLAKSKDLIGREASQFPSILSDERRCDPDSKLSVDRFLEILPATPENLAKLKESRLIDCWPALWITVDKRTGRIAVADIYLQCL